MRRAGKRLLLLDYDGTLIPQNNINCAPSEELLGVLRALCADARNSVYIISGRRKSELGTWFATVVRKGWPPGGLVLASMQPWGQPALLPAALQACLAVTCLRAGMCA